jgi:methanogenic corrinoid protein MtbC1
MVGGAPVNEKLARELGADIYTESAFEAANLILDELKREDG